MQVLAVEKEITFGSLFAGVGGFDAGFEAAGMSCCWQVEIDKDCRSVLTRQYPEAERFNDITEVGRHNLKPVDIICGGFPCQDLSVAGKRAGLSGERSGLFYEMVRVTDELRPMFLVWENVPGLLSSDDGRDFARVLRALDDIGYSGGWTGFDAQWFGVAQRRRRIFGVFAPRDIGAGSCAEILSLRESVRRNPPTRSQEGQGVARTITGGTSGGRTHGKQNGSDRVELAIVNSIDTFGGGPDDNSAQAGHIVTHTLKAEGHDASEDGTGRGVPIVPDVSYAVCGGPDGRQFGTGRDAQDTFIVQAFTQNTRDEVRLIGGDGQITGALNAESGMHQQNYIAFDWQSGGDVRLNCSDEHTSALQTNQTPAIGWHENKSGQLTPTDTAKALRAGASHSYQGVGVRRLTPRECERLQGFEDDWTRFDENGKEISDSARYRMLGNAVCVKNARWIGSRIKRLIVAYRQVLPIAVNE